jgi:hypothetical protein
MNTLKKNTIYNSNCTTIIELTPLFLLSALSLSKVVNLTIIAPVKFDKNNIFLLLYIIR